MTARSFLLVLSGAASCSPDDDTSSVGRDSGTVPAVPGPCAAGTWGAIDDPENAVHLSASGSDAGSGTVEAPVATWERALDLAGTGSKRIAVWPGSYATELVLSSGSGVSLDGLVLQGCSRDEVTLVGPSDGTPTLWVLQVPGVSVEGFTMLGGGIRVHLLDRTAAFDFEVEGVAILDVTDLGFVLDGPLNARVQDITIDGATSFGFAAVRGASVEATDLAVADVQDVGIFLEAASFAGTDITVSGTEPDAAGALGRGIHAQLGSDLSIDGAVFVDNSDAAVFALTCANVALTGVVIQGVDAGDAGGEPTGDGIVATAGDPDFDPTDYPVSLADVTILVDDVSRAGVYLETVTADLGKMVVEPDIYAAKDVVLSGETTPDFRLPLAVNIDPIDSAPVLGGL